MRQRSRIKPNFVLITTWWCLIICILNVSAQTPVETPEAPIKVETLLINIPLVVSDRDGRHIGGLAKEDFTILLDGEKQTIEYFADADESVSVAIIIDISGSTRPYLPSIRDAAKTFAAQLNPNDQGTVLTFDQHFQIEVVCQLTSDKKRLAKKIDSVGPINYAFYTGG